MNKSETKERAVLRFFDMKKRVEALRLYAIDPSSGADVIFERLQSLRRELGRISSREYAQLARPEDPEAELLELTERISTYEKKWKTSSSHDGKLAKNGVPARRL